MNIASIQTSEYVNKPNYNQSFGCLRLPKKSQKLSSDIDKFVSRMAKDSVPKEQPWSEGWDSISNWLVVDTKDGKTLHARILWGRVPSGKFCLFFHGGTSTASNYQDLYATLVNKNICVIPMDYVGYGDNKVAEANYKDLMKSSEGIYRHLTEKMMFKPEHISIVGYCLGGQVAANLASKVKCDSLFLINPMIHVSELSEGYLKSKNYKNNFVTKLLDKLSKYNPFAKYKLTKKMNAFRGVENINCPVYVLSSKEDAVVKTQSIDNFVQRLRDCGKEVEYVRDFGEGHKLTKEKIELFTSEMQDRLETDTDFLNWKHFGIPYPTSPRHPFA